MKPKITVGRAVGTVLVTLFAVLCVLPLLYMLAVSFTDSESLYIKLSDLRPDLSNYVYAITKRNFGQALKNSVITVVGSCLLVDIVSAMAACCRFAAAARKTPQSAPPTHRCFLSDGSGGVPRRTAARSKARAMGSSTAAAMSERIALKAKGGT